MLYQGTVEALKQAPLVLLHLVRVEVTATAIQRSRLESDGVLAYRTYLL